jgi:hypothetical protein
VANRIFHAWSDSRYNLRCGGCRREWDEPVSDDHYDPELSRCSGCGAHLPPTERVPSQGPAMPVGVCWEHGPGGSIRLSFSIRVF